MLTNSTIPRPESGPRPTSRPGAPPITPARAGEAANTRGTAANTAGGAANTGGGSGKHGGRGGAGAGWGERGGGGAATYSGFVMLAVQTAHAAATGPGAASPAALVLPTLLLAIAGLAVGTVGVLGLRGALPRNRWAGVRTAATMRDDTAFTLGNKVAGAPLLAAGAAAFAAGALGAVMPTMASRVTVAAVGLLGMLVLTLVGGALGHRAAAALPAPDDSCGSASGCAGCTALCSLR